MRMTRAHASWAGQNTRSTFRRSARARRSWAAKTRVWLPGAHHDTAGCFATLSQCPLSNTGVKHVTCHNDTYRVQIYYAGKQRNGGSYGTLEEAIAARDAKLCEWNKPIPP